VNVDFEDVRTVMGEPGKAMMGTAVASGPDRARIAAEQAVACPLLEGIDLSGAKGVLVLITAAKGSLKLSESKLAMNTIRAYASPDAHVIYGAAYDDGLGDEIRVTVVATGLSRQGQRRTAPPLTVLRTGTDNAPIQIPDAEQPAERRQRHDACHARRDPDRLRQHGRAQRVAHQAARRPRPASMRCPPAAWTTMRSRRSCASRPTEPGLIKIAGCWPNAPSRPSPAPWASGCTAASGSS
jgi:hypothetical protein